jgi:hypothetical protein
MELITIKVASILQQDTKLSKALVVPCCVTDPDTDSDIVNSIFYHG